NDETIRKISSKYYLGKNLISGNTPSQPMLSSAKNILTMLIAIIKRILLIPLALLISILGLLSIMAAVALTIAPFNAENGSNIGQIFLEILTFLFSGILFGFGLVTQFFALRCAIGSKPWLQRCIDNLMAQAVKYGLILGAISITCGIIMTIIKSFI
ncbi:MAG: hypothetical protein JW936_09390, partial [Sedimentisphaerales bacterium]|nr:hypothetical protein [Sedimentisphaerales bacterium]